jgi:hypothetical protein
VPEPSFCYLADGRSAMTTVAHPNSVC